MVRRGRAASDLGPGARSGCVPVAWSMDAPGPLTRSVEDAALLLSIIAGSDGRDR